MIIKCPADRNVAAYDTVGFAVGDDMIGEMHGRAGEEFTRSPVEFPVIRAENRISQLVKLAVEIDSENLFPAAKSMAKVLDVCATTHRYILYRKTPLGQQCRRRLSFRANSGSPSHGSRAFDKKSFL